MRMRLLVTSFQTKLRGLFSSKQGSAAIEYGVILPALLLFIFIIIDAGRLLWTQTTLDRAVEAAARCGAIDTINCATTGQIQDYASAQAFGMTIAPTTFTAGAAACGMLVTASFPFVPSVPLIPTGTITLTSSACYTLPPA